MNWKNRDMKNVKAERSYDWQPWVIAFGIWTVYVLAVPFLE